MSDNSGVKAYSSLEDGCSCTIFVIDRGVGPGEEMQDTWGCGLHSEQAPDQENNETEESE